jgi:hypothetical protein
VSDETRAALVGATFVLLALVALAAALVPR